MLPVSAMSPLADTFPNDRSTAEASTSPPVAVMAPDPAMLVMERSSTLVAELIAPDWLIEALPPISAGAPVIVTPCAAAPAVSTTPRSVGLAPVAVTTPVTFRRALDTLSRPTTAIVTLRPEMVPPATKAALTVVPLAMVIDTGLPGSMLMLTSLAATSAMSPSEVRLPALLSCPATSTSGPLVALRLAPAATVNKPAVPPVKL